MPDPRQKARRVALFVEGDTEQRTLPGFFQKWLDPRLPAGGKVGITPVKFHGVSNYFDDLPQKVALYLDTARANVVFGLIDLYGVPADRIDLSRYLTTHEKIKATRAYIRALVPQQYRDRFRQHFAVHEVEAWLLAYPAHWPAEIRSQITKKPPEQVNFDEPPAKLLKRILGRYKKTTAAVNVFSKVDPQGAINQCPYLKLLMEDLLRVALALQ